MARACGTCTFCCKVMNVTALDKPVDQWCAHCTPGKGCGAYATRPAECVDFACQWLGDPDFPIELKPDRLKVMFGPDGTGRAFMARCDPANPLAWRKDPAYALLKDTARRTWRTDHTVLASAGRRTWVITPAADYDLGEIEPDAPIEVRKRPDGTAVVTVRPVPETP